MSTPGAGRTLSFVHARRSRVEPDMDLIDRSSRRATFSQRRLWADRVAKETPERVSKRHDMETCKERPKDSRKGKGGASRSFVPWCKEK